jgi:phosphocarrier protein
MTQETTVARRQIEITNYLGLHMRPANQFVVLARQFQSDVRVLHNGSQFNGKSILSLTSLCAERGVKLELEARGPDAEEAVEALASLVAAGFNEDENGEPIPRPTTAAPPRSNSTEPPR